MRVDELDIAPEIKERFQSMGYVDLHPPQEEAAPLALQGKSLVVAIPTASGKSLIGYLAALKHVFEQGGKVLYIVPLKALASEKGDELREFASLGVKVSVATGDLDSEDRKLGHADIIVATSEKADSILRHGGSWMSSVTLTIADEVHLIHDPGRGPTLEVALTKLMLMNPDMQVIALSATISNASMVADWLKAELVSSEWRPVPLREGVYYDGELWFSDNGRTAVDGGKDPVWPLVEGTIKEGGQCLVFVNTRRSTESLATKMAPKMRRLIDGSLTDDDRSILEGEDEATSVGRKLATCVEAGVAFHHAGLSSDQRRAVERGFRKGTVKCIVATPTLAAGINLPARRVIVRDIKRYDSNNGNVPISVMEVKQMCGRAGRPRFDPYGEAVLIARSDPERDHIIMSYLLADSERVYSKLGSEPVLRSHALGLLSTGTASSREGIMDFLKATFMAQHSELLGLREAVDSVVDFFLSEEMLREKDGLLETTFYGKRVSDMYIDPLSAVTMRKALDSWNDDVDDLGVLHAACSTTDVLSLYLRKGDYGSMEELLENPSTKLLLPIPEDYGELEFFYADLKAAAMLRDWIDEKDEETILDTFSVGPGDLRNRVDSVEWMLYAMGELAGMFKPEAKDRIGRMRVRVSYGVSDELLVLVKLRNVGRSRARIMYDNGLRDLDSLREVDINKLASLKGIGPKLAKSIKSQLGINATVTTVTKKEETSEDPSGQSSLFDFN